MNGAKVAQNALKTAFEPFETLNSQAVKPIFDEARHELGAFFGTGLTRREKSMAQEDLKRAREEQKIAQMEEEASQNSNEKALQISATIKQEYLNQENRTQKENQTMLKEFVELQEEIEKLAKAAGEETKSYIENAPKKVGVLDIKRLTRIITFLRIKAEESKSAKELVSQRQNAKTTGMLAWVSGKQMKIHEQGTLLLQG